MKFLQPTLTAIVFFLASTFLFAQDSRLANQYFNTGEYEKAANLFNKLFKESKSTNDYYFNKYIRCLLALEEFERCEDEIKKQMKKRPKDVQLLVTFGSLYEMKNEPELANQQFEKAIDKLPANRALITRLGNSFIGFAKYDLAIKAYEKGEKLLKDNTIFSNNLADLYKRKGDISKMIHYYLNSLSANPNRLVSLKNVFHRSLMEEDYIDLQTQLYERIQEEPELIQFPELLEWVFIQAKDYKKALRQAKALDSRLEEDGNRVMKLGSIASNAKDYDAALAAFDYVIQNKGTNSRYYIESKKEYLANKRDKITSNFEYSKADMEALEAEYNKFLDEFGRNRQTAGILLEFSHLEAYFLNNLDKAIDIMSLMVKLPGVPKKVRAEGKISLADFYLIKGEIWEATLLYSQVDKDFREDYMGEIARYRNAKLSYYAGDFGWAQAQFDILKASTSKLISNDAIDMSVFITDNMGLDTTELPLKYYAEADLLIFQNRFDEAFQKFEQLTKNFPSHALEDDILYAKAQVYMKKKDYEKAKEMYEKIMNDFPEEIRCDNAIYELAVLYENQLKEKAKAQELYEKIFIDYSNSTFAVDARKRYRILRGDEIQ